MDIAGLEGNLLFREPKLHADMCRKLSAVVSRVLEIFPLLEAARPRSKSGIQALCSLHVVLDKSKNILQHCSESSKLYLAITSNSVLMKFQKAKSALQESLRRVEDLVPQAIGCQILEILDELNETVFTLDDLEKQAGDGVIGLLQKSRKCESSPNESGELEVFHLAATRLGITSSKGALTERRALKKLIDRTRTEEDRRKESIVQYLLHLLRKYSKIFRNEVADDTDSQGSVPCSPTVLGSFEAVFSPGRYNHSFERHLTNSSSLNIKDNGIKNRTMSIAPEEFRCPISLQLMYDPVIISSGQTYERVFIEKWFSDGHSTCPKTQQQLPHLYLTPNYCVKGLISSWCERNGVPVPACPPESENTDYWRTAISDCEGSLSRSISSTNSSKLRCPEVFPLEDSCINEECEENDMVSPDDSSCRDCEDNLERYEGLLAMLYDSKSMRKQCKAVEQIRLLLKDDDEARIFMGANGCAEALIGFLQSAINEGDSKYQELGAMALFNLAVNNKRNKEGLLSSGVIELLEQMIQNPSTYEAATALYLNLSCLDGAKPIIGSSNAVSFLVQILQYDMPEGSSCRHDALFALYNLSTDSSNISSLLSYNIVDALHSLLLCSSSVEKALAVLINIASTKEGKKDIVSTSGLIGVLAVVLDTGGPTEQEQAVACLLILCNGDEKCSQMVLQEGVIPALVSISVNGTPRGREKAQKLLKLFREQRKREQSPVRGDDHQQRQQGGVNDGLVHESKMISKSRSKKFGRTLSSIWKNRGFPVHHC